MTLRRIVSSREFSVAVVLILICAYMVVSPQRDRFYSSYNIQNMLRNISLLGVFAVGETIVIISGGIDLSLGSLISFTGMLLAILLLRFDQRLVTSIAIILAISVTLVVSFGIGAFHALMIHRLRLPPFVVTLASLLVLRSQARVMNNQLQIPISDYPQILSLANTTFFEKSSIPIPEPLIFFAIIAIVAAVILNRTRIGRYIYSIGSSETATDLSGVNVFKVKLFAYGASGLLGGLAGILWAAYTSQGDPNIAQAYELDAVAAAVVGGASLSGGQGSIAGTVLGATLLYVIFSAISLSLEKPDLWRGTIVGGILLLAVLVTAFQQRRATR